MSGCLDGKKQEIGDDCLVGRCDRLIAVWLGAKEGMEDGFSLGTMDGMEDGFSLGVMDIKEDGIILGARDGMEDGFSLGAIDDK